MKALLPLRTVGADGPLQPVLLCQSATGAKVETKVERGALVKRIFFVFILPGYILNPLFLCPDYSMFRTKLYPMD